MFNSSVLDIAIGLVLVYLLISILLTSVSEVIEAFFKTRASDLEHALSELFQGDPGMLRSFYEHPLISGLYRGLYRRDVAAVAPQAQPVPVTAGADNDGASMATPTTSEASTATRPAAQIAPPPMDAGGSGHSNLPAYIPREAFSAAVMDLLQSKGAPRLKQAVDALAAQQGIDPAATRRAVEGWYDGAMDRASGWFKRRTQRRLFILGLAIALIGNVNSVTIAQYLASSQEAREGLVQYVPQFTSGIPQPPPAAAPTRAGEGAENASAANSTATEVNSINTAPSGAAGNGVAAGNNIGNATDAPNASATTNGSGGPTGSAQRDQWIRDQYGHLRAVGLPIGWSDSVVALMVSGFPTVDRPPPQSPSSSYYTRLVLQVIILIAGYLVTAFAVMLGSPFWFDILNKLMVVRSTVKPREKSPDEPPVDGPAPAPPTGGTRPTR